MQMLKGCPMPYCSVWVAKKLRANMHVTAVLPQDTSMLQVLTSPAHPVVSRNRPSHDQGMGIPTLILFVSYIPQGASYHCHHQTSSGAAHLP